MPALKKRINNDRAMVSSAADECERLGQGHSCRGIEDDTSPVTPPVIYQQQCCCCWLAKMFGQLCLGISMRVMQPQLNRRLHSEVDDSMHPGPSEMRENWLSHRNNTLIFSSSAYPVCDGLKLSSASPHRRITAGLSRPSGFRDKCFTPCKAQQWLINIMFDVATVGAS